MINKSLGVLLLATIIVFAQPAGLFGAAQTAEEDQVALTEEQIEQIQELRLELERASIDIRANIQKLRLDLNEQLAADEPNRRAINSTLDDIGAEQVALEKLEIGFRLDVRDLLTDEQKEVSLDRLLRQSSSRNRTTVWPLLRNIRSSRR